MDARIDPFDELWQEHRAHTVNVAFRMLGNISDAEDVSQEAFARLARANRDDIKDVGGWLVVVVGRLCLDHLRAARVRREQQHDPGSHAFARLRAAADPADRVTLDDSVRSALVVVLQRLTPAERTVFVLREVFQYPFETVAEIVGRSPAACRQLGSRARHKIQSGAPDSSHFMVAPADERRIADEFVVACGSGRVDSLMRLLDPDVVGLAHVGGVERRQVGRDDVGENIMRFFARPDVTLVTEYVGPSVGVLAFRDRELGALLAFEIRDGRIVHIDGVADPRLMAA